MSTQWRAVRRNENYEVSSDGRVRRCRAYNSTHVGKVLKPFPHADGHLLVKLSRDGKATNVFVHQLVCEAFHGPRPSPEHQVAHGDGDHLNNNEGNLRWATQLENSADMVAHGRSCRGASNGNAVLTEASVRTIRGLIRANETNTNIAVLFEVTRKTIANIRNGKTWSHVQ